MSGYIINEYECEKAGLDPKEVKKLASRFSRLAVDCDKLGITIFCGSVNSLRFSDESDKGSLIIASINARNTDGGCGSEGHWGDDFLRGESDQ